MGVVLILVARVPFSVNALESRKREYVAVRGNKLVPCYLYALLPKSNGVVV